MIPLLENTEGINITNIETIVGKTAKAKVALAKVEIIGNGAYNAYLLEKGISEGKLHASRFVTVRNIHFVYRQRTHEEIQKEVIAAEEARKAAEEARKAREEANARIAAENAKKAANARKDAQSMVDDFIQEAGNPSDQFFLFKVVKNLLDPKKMGAFL
jgi:hypothetical protein